MIKKGRRNLIMLITLLKQLQQVIKERSLDNRFFHPPHSNGFISEKIIK
jgi:hypothetical protein